MNEYAIVSGETLEALVFIVNQQTATGWRVKGGPFVVSKKLWAERDKAVKGDLIAQALVRGQVVFISGVWDLLHDGHRNVLEKARGLGDFLVVGVVTDRFAASYKSLPSRDFEQRCQDVLALPCVDAAEAHDDFDDMSIIDKYGVSIRAVGPEYGNHEEQKQCLAEMERRGIRVVIIPRTDGISTSQIKEQLER